MPKQSPPKNYSERNNWIFASLCTGVAACVAWLIHANIGDACMMVVSGALAGYCTNLIAVHFLFNPTVERPGFRLGGPRLGIFYKNREQFGERLVDMACERFLSPAFFTDLVQAAPVRTAIAQGIQGSLEDIGATQWGTPRDIAQRILGTDEAVNAQQEKIAHSIADALSYHMIVSARDGRLETMVAGILEPLHGLTFGDILGNSETRKTLVRSSLRQLSSAGARTFMVRELDQLLEEARTSRHTLNDIMGASICQELSDFAGDYMHEVLAVEIGRFMQNPELRQKIISIIQDDVRQEIDEKVQKKGVVARFFIDWFAKDDLDEIPEAIPEKIASYFDRIDEYLADPEIRDLVTGAVQRQLKRLWNQPISALVRLIPAPFVARLVHIAADTIQSPDTLNALTRRICAIISEQSERKIADIFPDCHADTLAHSITHMIRRLTDDSTRMHAISHGIQRMTTSIFTELAQIELPKLESLSLWSELKASISNAATEHIRKEIPNLITHLPVRENLRNAWANLSNEAIRENVYGVMKAEFAQLINAGITLGAIAGLLLWSIQMASAQLPEAIPNWALPALILTIAISIKSLGTRITQ